MEPFPSLCYLDICVDTELDCDPPDIHFQFWALLTLHKSYSWHFVTTLRIWHFKYKKYRPLITLRQLELNVISCVNYYNKIIAWKLSYFNCELWIPVSFLLSIKVISSCLMLTWWHNLFYFYSTVYFGKALKLTFGN